MATSTRKPRATAPATSDVTGASFTVSREQLTAGLAAIGPIVPAKPTLPILGSVRIEALAGELRFTANDLDTAVSVRIPADVENTGAMTVPAKRLMAIAKELPPAPVRFRYNFNGKLTVDCGRAHFQLLTLPVLEFPELPSISFDSSAMQAGQLNEMVKRAIFATSKEESRPILNGVLWQREDDVMRLVATDGHRLALLERSIEAGLGSDLDVIVPPKALELAARLFEADDEIEIGFGENHLGLQSLTVVIYSRLIEGPYPSYLQVIPKQSAATREITVNRASLVSALRRCVPIAPDGTHRTALEFGRGMISISASTPDVGEMSDEIPVRMTGEPVTLGINVTFALQVLGAITTDEVLIQISAPERAVMFFPVGEPAPMRSRFLVMPMRLLDD